MQIVAFWYTVQWEAFEGENFREFQDFVAIPDSFRHEIWGHDSTSQQSVKFSSRKLYFPPTIKSFPLYGIVSPPYHEVPESIFADSGCTILHAQTACGLLTGKYKISDVQSPTPTMLQGRFYIDPKWSSVYVHNFSSFKIL